MTIHHSDTITKLMGALLKVQGQVDGVAKTAVNPHFRKNYADLEAVIDAIRQPCLDAGLVVVQAPGECSGGTLSLTTMITHAESGEWLKSTAQIPVEKAGPQGAGSAITYAERYSLLALFNLPAVDDDGEAAQRPVQARDTRPASSPAPRQEARPAQPDGSPDGIRARMLAALNGAKSIEELEKLTGQVSWKASLAGLPEAHRVTVGASAVKRYDDLVRADA